MSGTVKLLDQWPHKTAELGLSSPELTIIKETARLFLLDKLPHLNLDFQVWQWSLPQLYGIFLGMGLNAEIIINAEHITLFLSTTKTIVSGYCSNSYHNFLHAFDVAYMVYYMIMDLAIGKQLGLSRQDKAVLLIAALGHDVRHPGLNNLFQVNSKSDLAIKYANISVLESYSADVLIEILQSHSFWTTVFPGCEAPPPNSTTLSLTKMNQLMRSIILMTDMAHHFCLLDDLAVFAHTVSSSDTTIIVPSEQNSAASSREDIGTAKSGSTESMLEKINLPDVQTKETIMCALLHAADISNPARPFEICKKWSDWVNDEFFAQGEQERKLGLPISPNMDQLKANQIQMSIGFTNSIVKPLYEMLAMLFPMSQVFVDLLIDNGRNWINLLQVKIPADELAQLHKDSKEDGLNKIRKFSFAAGTVDIPNDGLSNWSKMTYTSTSSRKFSVVSGRKVSMFKPGGSVRRPFGSEQIQVTEGSRYAQLIKRPISGSELPEISMSPLSSDFTELAITAEE